jgi:hypothetical protein
MSPPVLCAAPGCENPVLRRPGQSGRPPIYCSPTCRPSYTRPTVTVEVEQADGDDQPGRDWVVRLRRGRRVVVLGHGLGRFSATAFASELRCFLEGPSHRAGDAP